MSIIYNSNNQTHNNNLACTIMGTHDMRKADVFRNGSIKSRTNNGGFVAWPENNSASYPDTIEETSVNRTRSGGFIAWPK